MEDNIKKASYSGILEIGNAKLYCYVLEDGMRILSATSIFTAFGRTRKGKRSQEDKSFIDVEGGRAELPPFLPKNLINLPEGIEKPHNTVDLMEVLGWAEEVRFYDGGFVKTGYQSQLLVEMCNLYIDARKFGYLLKTQTEAALAAEILLQAFAKVGLDGLIDEVTGYKHNPKYEGLRVLLNQYIAEGLQKWTKTFPDKFFELLDRLYENEKTSSRSRPQYYGRFINKYIYEPLERGYVKEELNKLNITEDGKRRARFFQWLTERGKNELILQIGQVMGIMQSSSNLRNYKNRFERLDSPSLFTEEQWEELTK